MNFKYKSLIFISILILVLSLPCAFAAITEQQGEDVAAFAKAFIEEGNARKDENGFPLLTYCLSGNWRTCVEIRTKGYNGQMYYVKNNGYYYRNGKYLELGNKWCMDCGTTVLFLLKNTLGLELLNSQGEPWHVQDIYNDALKGKKSKYFEMVYSGVSVGKINYSKLKKGDIIARITSDGNHGMLYLGDGYIAHANRDMIRSYGDNKVSGFQVNKLNHYFLPGTVVRIMRIKDGIIPEDLVVNGVVTWPDTGETVDLLHRDEAVQVPSGEVMDNSLQAVVSIETPATTVETAASTNIQDVVQFESQVLVNESNDTKKVLLGENIVIEEAIKNSAEEKVSQTLDNKVLLAQILDANRPVFYGPYMKYELAKLQNDAQKQAK